MSYKTQPENSWDAWENRHTGNHTEVVSGRGLQDPWRPSLVHPIFLAAVPEFMDELPKVATQSGLTLLNAAFFFPTGILMTACEHHHLTQNSQFNVFRQRNTHREMPSPGRTVLPSSAQTELLGQQVNL